MDITNLGFLQVAMLSAYIVPPHSSHIDASNRWNLSPYQPETDRYLLFKLICSLVLVNKYLLIIERYDISTFNELSQYGDRYSGAGFIITGSSQPPSIQLASLRCISGNSFDNSETDGNRDNNENDENENNENNDNRIRSPTVFIPNNNKYNNENSQFNTNINHVPTLPARRPRPNPNVSPSLSYHSSSSPSSSQSQSHHEHKLIPISAHLEPQSRK